MRRILVDHARARRSQKRGGNAAKVTFDEALVVTSEPAADFVALDDALEALAKFDERKSRVIEMRFFGGLSVEETASVLEGVARYCAARLAAGEGVAAARDARRRSRSAVSAGTTFIAASTAPDDCSSCTARRDRPGRYGTRSRSPFQIPARGTR